MTTEIKKPEAILFDWDNTLVDTWPVIYASIKRTFETMDKTPWSFEETKENIHLSLRDSFPDLFGDRWEEAGRLYLQYFEEIHLQEIRPLDGAKEVLDLLADSDIYVAVVSNKTGYNLRAEIKHLGWNHYFKKEIGAKDAEEDKPSKKPIEMALEGSSINMGNNIWFVGDSITDMQCAYNSNSTPVFYGDQDLSLPKFKDYQPKYHFNNHDELLLAVKEITSI